MWFFVFFLSPWGARYSSGSSARCLMRQFVVGWSISSSYQSLPPGKGVIHDPQDADECKKKNKQTCKNDEHILLPDSQSKKIQRLEIKRSV